MSFANWWSRSLGRHALLGSTALVAGCWGPDVVSDPPPMTEDALTFDQDVEALELQQQRGWHVGTQSTYLTLPRALEHDVDDSNAWRAFNLPSLLAPKTATLQPFYVPTLFQAWNEPANADLRQVIEPIYTAAMRDAALRAQGVMSLLEDARWPSDLAIIVDLPGPESVALAAQLADKLDPVFAFGNWPHPLGVVPAQDTLAAALYYAPQFARSKLKRAGNAPPLFVLDANRLAPYGDEEDAFDNRYVARLPTATALRQLGYTRVLYVNEYGNDELDDLNDAFVDMQQNGVDVRMMSLNDIDWSDVAPVTDDAPEVVNPVWVEIDNQWLYWGGSARAHHCFWYGLGWPYGHHDVSLSMRHLSPDPMAPRASDWRPQLRQTLFSAGAPRIGMITHQPHRPSGFGAMSARYSRATGHMVAMGRSGSFGRGGGGHGG